MKTKNLFIITAVLTIVLVAKHETYSYALEPYQIDLGLGAAESYKKTGDITAQGSSHESSNELSSDNKAHQATHDDHDKENKASSDVSKAGMSMTEAIKRKFEQDGLKQNPYHFDNYDEAAAELRNPRAVFIPSNVDIALRGIALTPYLVPANKTFALGGRMEMKYFVYMNLIMPIVDKYGDVNIRKTIEHFVLNKEDGYNALEWTVSIKTEMESGASMPVIIGVKNISESAVNVSCFDADLSFFYLNSIIIRKTTDNHVVMLTSKGARDYYNYAIPVEFKWRPIVTLNPNESYEFGDRSFDLVENYDLSEPGEYELTFFTRNYNEYTLDELPEYKYPRKTTVRFTILPKSEETGSESE